MMQEANHVFELNVRLFSSFEPLVDTPAADSRAVYIRTDSSPASTRSSTPRDTPNRIAIIPNPFTLVGPSTPVASTVVVPATEAKTSVVAAWRAPMVVLATAALAVGVAMLIRTSRDQSIAV